jgi:dihydrolipoamide dehydrogenase
MRGAHHLRPRPPGRPNAIVVATGPGGTDFDRVEADTLVVAVGASPRELDPPSPDGERILTWTQLYDMKALPEHLIVVGSGVTGAEFASAYMNLGAKVTLISSRDQVLPGEDQDAAHVLEKVFKRGGMRCCRSRAPTRSSAPRRRRRDALRRAHGRGQPLPDGRRLDPEHCGHRPRGGGVELTESGHIRVNRVARTSVRTSTPPATARTSSRWPRSPRCRAAPRSSTRSATS